MMGFNEVSLQLVLSMTVKVSSLGTIISLVSGHQFPLLRNYSFVYKMVRPLLLL